MTRQAAEQATRGQAGPGGAQVRSKRVWQKTSDGSGSEAMNPVQDEEDLERAVQGEGKEVQAQRQKETTHRLWRMLIKLSC